MSTGLRQPKNQGKIKKPNARGSDVRPTVTAAPARGRKKGSRSKVKVDVEAALKRVIASAATD